MKKEKSKMQCALITQIKEQFWSWHVLNLKIKSLPQKKSKSLVKLIIFVLIIILPSLNPYAISSLCPTTIYLMMV